ncbi:MAG: hypothetical protein ACRD4E_16060 [Bryobacteraceae bacterium]
MPSNAGEKQEQLLFKYLQFERHCFQVIEGDQQVRNFLGMKGMFKCADALGLHQSPNSAGPRRFTVAESKGTDMNSAVEQLGNAAAGVFEKFGREAKIDLLVMVSALVERPSGALSPGHGYRVDPLKTGLNKFALQESMGGPILPAQPRVTYPEWVKWSAQVASLRIVVLTLQSAAS